jgi:hypothetical protein
MVAACTINHMSRKRKGGEVHMKDEESRTVYQSAAASALVPLILVLVAIGALIYLSYIK